MKKTIFIISILTIAFVSCEKDKESKKENFNSPEEFLDNPSVENAIGGSNIPIYYGDTPPVLSGVYHTSGSVTDASLNVCDNICGRNINSIITLSHQTVSGSIDLKEQVSGNTVYGNGGYIIGGDGFFSIFQESIQSGGESGLPSGVSVTVVLIMSGKKLDNGNLIAEGISIITKATSSNKDYNIDVAEMEKTWWMWEASFTLEGYAEKTAVLERMFYFPDEVKNLFVQR